MSTSIEIGGEGGHVTIDVLGYENPGATNTSDANWLSCRTEVTVRSFSGQVDAAFNTQDFAVFFHALREAVDQVAGIAIFETDEDALRLEVEFSATGTARIKGSLREPDRPTTTLTFTFESDRGRLVRAVQELGTVTSRFPVRLY